GTTPSVSAECAVCEVSGRSDSQRSAQSAIQPSSPRSGEAWADTVIRLNLNAISTIGVVGLGTIGSQELALWQRSGHQTVGYDISEAQVKAARDAIKANSGPAPRLSTRITDLNEADVLILCLPNLAPSGENSMAAFDHFVGDAGALDE